MVKARADGRRMSPTAVCVMACVSVAHAAGLGALMRGVIAPAEGGEAPVINLTLEPSPRFDSPTPPAPEVRVEAPGGGAAAPARRQVRVVVREGQRPTPEAFMIAAKAPQPFQPEAAAIARPHAAAARAQEGPEGAGATAQPSSEAGSTQDGGGRTLGAAAARLEDDYAARVLGWVEQHKRAPGGVSSGVVTVHFLLDRRGTVRDLRLVGSSGSRALDQAALDQIRNTQPFPRPEPGAAWRTRSFTMNIDYRVRADR